MDFQFTKSNLCFDNINEGIDVSLESNEDYYLDEINIFKFLLYQKELIFKISKKLKKAENIKDVFKNFVTFSINIKRILFPEKKGKIKSKNFTNFDNSVFVFLNLGKMNSLQNCIYDTMFVNNSSDHKNINKKFPIKSLYNDDIFFDNLEITDQSQKINFVKYHNTSIDEQIDGKITNYSKKNNILDSNFNSKTNKLLDKLCKNNKQNLIINHVYKEDFECNNQNNKFNKILTQNFDKLNDDPFSSIIDNKLQNSIKISDCDSLSKKFNRSISQDCDYPQNIVFNEMSIFPSKNLNTNFRPKNDILSNNIKFETIERNIFENIIKDIIFLILISDDIFFDTTEENTNFSLKIIFLFLELNFTSDVNLIHTIIIKICKILRREYSNIFSNLIKENINKLNNTASEKFLNVSEKEKNSLVKVLEESLETLEYYIKANNKTDPINYLKLKDNYVKNILANKVNDFEVEEISEKFSRILDNPNEDFNNSYKSLNKLNIEYSIRKKSKDSSKVENKNSIINHPKKNKDKVSFPESENSQACLSRRYMKNPVIKSENSPDKTLSKNGRKSVISLDRISSIEFRKRENLDFNRFENIDKSKREDLKFHNSEDNTKYNSASNEKRNRNYNLVNKNDISLNKENILNENNPNINNDFIKKKYNKNKNEKELNALKSNQNNDLINLNTIIKVESNIESLIEDNFQHQTKKHVLSYNSKEKNKIYNSNNTLTDYINNNEFNNDIKIKSNNNKKGSSINTESFSSIILNKSSTDFKQKIKENICTEKLIDNYIQLKFESEILDKKMEDLHFDNQLITNFTQNEFQYLYILKSVLEKIDDLLYRKNPLEKNIKSDYLKDKFFYICFRSNIFGEYFLKKIKIHNNFLLIENKSIFLDKLYKIGKFLYVYLLENKNLKCLDFTNRNEFTKLSCNIFNKFQKMNNIEINLALENKTEENDLLALQKLNFKELQAPYIELRIKINSIIVKVKNLILRVFKEKNLEETEFDCFEPYMANSLNYLEFYNSNLFGGSEIFLNFNLYNLKSKSFLLEIIKEIKINITRAKEIKDNVLIDNNDGVVKIIMKIEKDINKESYIFHFYITFNCEECFQFDNLLNFIEFDVNILHLFRILKFFLIQRNIFYSLSSVIERQKNETTNFQNFIFDNVSLLSLIVIFFLESGIMPYKESHFEYRKFYCQRINKEKSNLQLTEKKIDEHHYIFPYPLGRKKNTIKQEEKYSTIHSLGNLFINFCYFILNIFKAAKDVSKKNEDNISLILDIEKVLYFYSCGKEDIKIILAGMDKFVNTVSLSQIENLTGFINNSLIKERNEAKRINTMNRQQYEKFIKNFKPDNKGKETLILLNNKKMEIIEKEFVRLLHYFLKENEADFLKGFFMKIEKEK